MKKYLKAVLITSAIGSCLTQSGYSSQIDEETDKLTKKIPSLTVSTPQKEEENTYIAISAQAEELQIEGDLALSQKNYQNAAENYIRSLETVFDNYDLHCFLKGIKFNYNQVADIKGNATLRSSLVQDLSQKLGTQK